MNYPIVWYSFIIFLKLSIFIAWHCHLLLWVIGGCYPSPPVSELLESLKHFFDLCLGIAIWYIDAGVGRFKCSWVGGFSHQRLHVYGKCLCFVIQKNCLNNLWHIICEMNLQPTLFFACEVFVVSVYICLRQPLASFLLLYEFLRASCTLCTNLLPLA